MDYQQAANQLLALSQTMLEHANAGRWDDVVTVSNERDALIQDMASLEQPSDPQLNADMIKLLKDVLNINQKLEDLGNVELDRCAKDLKDVAKSKKGALAYINT